MAYTPLFTRPVVLEMMREWIPHALKRRKIARKDFLTQLDRVVVSQLKRLLTKTELPSMMRGETQEGLHAPFGDHPLLGHVAIYSINLILLRAIVGDGPFVFDETQIGTHEDGARPWDRLAHVWRSWFSLDILNGVTAVMLSTRREGEITVRVKERFQVAESQNRLEICLNVAVSLGDNIASGLTGLLLFEPRRDSPLPLEDVAGRLESERIDLGFQVAMKRLVHSERSVAPEDAGEFAHAVREVTRLALRADRREELEQILLSVRRVVRRLTFGVLDVRRPTRRAIEHILRELLDPRMATEIAFRNPQAAAIL